MFLTISSLLARFFIVLSQDVTGRRSIRVVAEAWGPLYSAGNGLLCGESPRDRGWKSFRPILPKQTSRERKGKHEERRQDGSAGGEDSRNKVEGGRGFRATGCEDLLGRADSGRNRSRPDVSSQPLPAVALTVPAGLKKTRENNKTERKNR